ncbi:hypothetical protein BUPH_08184 (plasmid) [Paraburkholderia phenoliruptrix BR3459a]|uniref:Uncharacterized protein n=1 Tax=Paraburkholderia phenoliruptrix BR3459a TaxID=1229205 RepID=K0DYK5_9BURK|nr:hypothetical protein BUPH_08184 [Paraburkholderia phenoliruptrix BR3459a]
MLGPHEFASLMLVRQAPDQLELNRAEFDALLERQLVMLEHRASGARRAYLTGRAERFSTRFARAAHREDRRHRRWAKTGEALRARWSHDGHRGAGTRRPNGCAIATTSLSSSQRRAGARLAGPPRADSPSTRAVVEAFSRMPVPLGP